MDPKPLPDPGEPRNSHRTRNGLPRGERLAGSASIREVFDRGRAVHGSRLVAFVLIRPGEERGFAVVAGRRIGGAVQRNRAKRLLREAYRTLKAELPARGFHLVVVARRGCDTATVAEVTAEMRKLLAGALGTSAPPSSTRS